MRIVFMGTPAFAATILDQLVQAYDVVGVFTQPDAVRSRGKKLEPSPVKQTALSHEIPVFEYATFKDNDAFDQLEGLAPDVICVAAYGVLLSKEVIDLPPYGCLNVHGSLLPCWRGAAPIERAILANDAEVGVCIMQMEAGLDTGAYCHEQKLPCGDLSAPELTDRLADLGAQALLEVLAELKDGSLEWTIQDESLVTYAHKIEKGELDIAPEMSANEALLKIRASSENHPAKCSIGGKDVTVVSAALADSGADAPQAIEQIEAGQVLFVAKRLYLGFSDGALELMCVHPSGKEADERARFCCRFAGCEARRSSLGRLWQLSIAALPLLQPPRPHARLRSNWCADRESLTSSSLLLPRACWNRPNLKVPTRPSPACSLKVRFRSRLRSMRS